MKKKSKKKKIIFSIVVIVLIAIISAFYFLKQEVVEYNFSLAERLDLVQEISSTGRIKAVDDLDLAFEKSGKIEMVSVEVGGKVAKGQVLVSLDSDDVFAEIAQARASVSSAEAKLSQYEAILEKEENELEILQAGTRDEEILIYESKVGNAEAVYDAAIQSIVDNLGDAYTKSDDAIRNKIDPMFTNPRGTNPQITFTINDSQLEADIEWGRSLIEQQLVLWGSAITNLSTDLLQDEIMKTENKLDEIKSFLSNMALAVNSLSISSGFTQTTIDTYKTNIYTARTNVNTAITNLSLAKEKFNTAQTSLLIAENELALKEADSTPEKINSQKATIKQAEANVASQQAEIELKKSMVQSALVNLSKYDLYSPIKGIVTKQEADIGTIVSAGEIIVSVISEDDLEIESNIVEADVAYLKVGNKATLSLDAYGEDVIFTAEVIKIDPSAQLIEGVANYKTTLKLLEVDERVRAGMTADIDIVTKELKGVLVVPYRAIIFKNGSGKFIRVLDESFQVKEVKVEIGIIGNGSLVEITEGINEGDKVITSIKSNK
ncbi:MAG: efflux RND transporter periplasmic adaptor subunit [Patescibacteria group bacterium]|nr:efflux RND transporter periplasmic adaptor subunit [Patescibacteria group bacterium]